MEWFITSFLILVGLVDIYRIIRKKDTVSTKVHNWFAGDNRWIDYVILIGLLVIITFIFGQVTFNRIMIGVILGHFFWNE